MTEDKLRKCDSCGVTIWAADPCPICPELANRYQVVTPSVHPLFVQILDSMTRLSDPASGSPKGRAQSAAGRIPADQPAPHLSTEHSQAGDN